MTASLSIILTLRDRPVFTMRLMRYLNETRFPVHILIGDGGKNTRIEKILKESKIFPNVNYSYYRYPYDASYKDYYRKMHDLSMKVKSPYCVFADNDNFFTLEALQKSVEFLEKNKDYSACQGRTICFRLGGSYYSQKVAFSRPLPQSFLKEERAEDRLKKIVKKNFATFYTVQRTENLRKSLFSLKEHAFSNLYMMEVFLHMFTLIQGKVHSLDIPYMFRQFDSVQSSNDELEKKGTQYDFLFHPMFSSEFEMFTETLSEALQEKDSVDKETARSIVVDTYKELTAPIIHHILNKRFHKYPQKGSFETFWTHLKRVQKELDLFLFKFKMRLQAHPRTCKCSACEKQNVLRCLMCQM